MKVQFSKEVRFTPTWRDNATLPSNEQILIYLTPLKMGELLDLLDILKGVGFTEGEVVTLSTAQMRQVLMQGSKYVPPHVTKIEGNEGYTVEDIVSYSEFFGLATEIIFELVRISSPSKADVKN